jgi:rubredoxin
MLSDRKPTLREAVEAQACCAHLQVSYTPIELDRGLMRNRWSCNNCGHDFAPLVPALAEQPEREPNGWKCGVCRFMFETQTPHEVPPAIIGVGLDKRACPAGRWTPLFATPPPDKPPADIEAAYKKGWSDREADIFERIEMIAPPNKPPFDAVGWLMKRANERAWVKTGPQYESTVLREAATALEAAMKEARDAPLE